MKLIDHVHSYDPSDIQFEIPFYHRVALGLETNTTVFLTPVPRPLDDKCPFNELLVTTIDPSRWSNIWRLSLTLSEGKGRVSQVLESLRDSAININMLETLTTEHGRVHALLAILDLSGVPGADMPDAPVSIDLLGTEQHQVALAFGKIADKWLSKAVAPSTLTRLQRLYDASKLRQEHQVSVCAEAKVKKGKIRPNYPEQFLTYLVKNIQRTAEAIPRRFLLFSDTEEKHVTVHFVSESDVLLRASISHGDRPGAIFDFTDGFSTANIINSYSRLRKSGDSAQWKVTLDVTGNASCSELLRAAQSHSALGAQAFFEFDSIDVSYGSASTRRTSDQRIAAGYSARYEATNHFVGRDDLITTIIERSRRLVPGVFLLNAYTGSGKSLLLRKIRELLSSDGELFPVLFLRKDVYRSRSISDAQASRTDAEIEAGRPQRAFHIWWSIIAMIHESLYEVRTGKKAGDKFMAFFLDRTVAPEISEHLKDYMEHDLSFVSVFEKTVVDVKKSLNKRIVLMIDNAEVLLDPSPAPSDQLDVSHRQTFTTQWKHVTESIPELAWVMASATHCLRTSVDTGVLLDPVSLYALDDVSARDLVTRPFAAKKITVTTPALASIIELSGRQPLYIQAICYKLEEEINAAPPNVDIITAPMVSRAAKASQYLLAAQFSRLRTDIVELAGEDVYRELLSDGRHSHAIRLDRFLAAANRDISADALRAMPGIEVRPSEENSDGVRGWSVRLNPLLRSWGRDQILQSSRRTASPNAQGSPLSHA